MRSLLRALALSVSFALPLAAQDSTSATTKSGDVDAWSMQRCLLGLSYGAPLKLAVGYGRGMLYENPNGGADVCVFGAGKVGFGGARASLGVARSVGALGGGAGISAGVVRTFSNPLNAIANRNYVGASLHLYPLIALGGEIGWYTRLGGEGPDAPSRSMIAWSVGFGF